MSTLRLGDMAAGTPLNLLAVSASGGSRPVPSLRGIRAGQLNQGVLAVSGGGGADTLDVKLQESDPPELLDQINGYDGVDDGSIKLREGAATQVLLAIPFTPTENVTIYSAKLQLSRLGTIAADKSVWVYIDTDAAGDPAGAAVSGAQALATSRKILCSAIATDRNEVTFFFDDGIDLTAATQYWLVVDADYTESAVNCIQVHYNTVVGTSGCKKFDAAWAAIANNDIWFRLQYLQFTDIAGAALAQITEGWLNEHDILERLELNMETVKDTVRAHYTVSGGTWYVATVLNVGLPLTLPLT